MEEVGLVARVKPVHHQTGQLQVLLLVLTDGHLGGAVEQNVGRLQHGIREKAEAEGGGGQGRFSFAPLRLRLEARERTQAGEDPSQFCVTADLKD